MNWSALAVAVGDVAHSLSTPLNLAEVPPTSKSPCKGVEFTLETDTNSIAETGPLLGMSAVEGGER